MLCEKKMRRSPATILCPSIRKIARHNDLEHATQNALGSLMGRYTRF